MERALQELAERKHDDNPDGGGGWTLVQEYPLSSALLAVCQVFRRQDGDGELVVAAKGAPEAIAELCHLSAERRVQFDREVAALAQQGLRVLGVARGTLRADALPEDPHDLRLELVGQLGFEDPLRPNVPAAVAECLSAGVRVIMITGDSADTARNMAHQAGIPKSEVLAGAELEGLSDDELAVRLRRVNVFARVVPEQKLRIVQALRTNGEVVAMTGDGVNDAPALKAAHIGIAMGARGTDVAREASALVLLDDDFSSLVGAVRLGRRIFDNIKKAIAFTIAVHVPIAGLSVLPVFFADWPLLMLPVHIVFLEMIIDPSCVLVFEAEEPEMDVMKRPPRSQSERLFSRNTLGAAFVQGLALLGGCLTVFFLTNGDHPAESTRALTFATLVVGVVTLIFINRSWSRSAISMLRVPNQALTWVLLGASVFLALALLTPFGRSLFHFGSLHPAELLLALGVGFASVAWFELAKLIWKAPPTPRHTAPTRTAVPV
jgi:Ca2+-transporting ATPase